MIHLKTDKEIALMKTGGKILHDVVLFAETVTKPGMTTLELNDLLEAKIIEQGGEAGFKRVHGYSWASCICINEQVVHTPPSDRVIQAGDVVTIDIGVFYKGFHTDSATTIQLKPQNQEVTTFLQTGRNALKKALKAAQKGNRIGHISLAFQTEIESAGYSIVAELTGHGVGKKLHEDPFIPCFLDMPIDKTPLLESGMTLALEVMYTMGKPKIKYESDGWSIKIADNSIAATFEHSIAITDFKTVILT